MHSHLTHPRVALFTLVLVLTPTLAKANVTEGPVVMVETDPATFAFGGHSAHLRVAPKELPGLVVGAGIYGLDMPSFITDVNSENRDEGWNATIKNGYGLFFDYHPSGEAEGLFFGLQAAIQEFGVERDSSVEHRSFHVALAMARVGTLWKPFDLGFYLLPWAGVGGSFAVGDSGRTLGGEEYDVAPVSGFATLHVGWQL